MKENKLVVFFLENPLAFLALFLVYMVFTFLFSLVYFTVLPGAMNQPALIHNTVQQASTAVTYEQAYYFSVITQTTVGYGDIIPSHSVARLVVSIQALFGYFYLGLIISTATVQIFIKKNAKKEKMIKSSPLQN